MSSRIRNFIARIPHRDIIRAGKVLGFLIYVMDGRHRRIVRRNLRFAYPQWASEKIWNISRGVFQNFGMTAIEIFQLAFFSKEDILNRIRIRGKEYLLDALRNPNPGGMIIISAHLGNWEMAPLLSSCFLKDPMVAVARFVRPKILNQWINRLRGRLGTVIIDKKRALPKLTRALRRGRTVGLLIDQATVRSEGVEVSFFQHTVTATPAAALLARRYACPVIPIFCVREKDGELALLLERPITVARTDDSQADMVVNTQHMVDVIEKTVRAYPEQWFWFHKRWKRHYPQLYPEDIKRKLRQRRKRSENQKKAHQEH